MKTDNKIVLKAWEDAKRHCTQCGELLGYQPKKNMLVDGKIICKKCQEINKN